MGTSKWITIQLSLSNYTNVALEYIIIYNDNIYSLFGLN